MPHVVGDADVRPIGQIGVQFGYSWHSPQYLAFGKRSSTGLAQSPGTNATPDQTVQWAATLSATGGVKQGSATTLELSGEILDGWHVYALTEPPGGPTALRVTLDENEVAQIAGTPSGPAPRRTVANATWAPDATLASASCT